MALAAGMIGEIRTTGSKDNAGYYLPGGEGSGAVDYSQQAAAQAALTGLTSGGATDTVATASADASWLNNGVKFVSGTNVTAGYYYIIAVTPGVSFQVDRNWCTGIAADGVANVGGAWCFGNDAGDDTFLDAGPAGNKIYVKQGTYSSGSFSLASAAGANPKVLEGYNTVRGDKPTTLATMPIISFGASNTSTTGNTWDFRNIVTIHGSVAGLNLGSNGRCIETKHLNNSTTANRAAITAGTDNLLLRVEGISYRGNAVTHNGTPRMIGCYFHDSNNGANHSSTAANSTYDDCIFAGNVNAAINDVGARSLAVTIKNCVLYGANNKLGTGWALASGALDSLITNSVITGFVTGLSHADAEGNNPMNLSEYNTFHNNTSDVSNWTKGSTDIALAPEFNFTQRTGATATTSGSTITQSGATFQTWGVRNAVNGFPQDFIYIKSGTGITAGIYGILTVDSETQLTLDIAPGTNATADKVWQIDPVRDFKPGANLQRAGMPMPGNIGTNYRDIGALQGDATPFYTDLSLGDVDASRGDYKYNSSSNNRTPTLVQPDVSDVLDNVFFGAGGTEFEGTHVDSGGGGGTVNLTDEGVILMQSVGPLTRFNIQGRNTDVDTGTEDIWNEGASISFPAAAATTTIVSSSVNDAAAGTGARTVKVHGLDANFNRISETATLNGTNAVTLTNSYYRINLVEVLTAGSGLQNAGTIQVKHTATVIHSMAAGLNRSSTCAFTVPAHLKSCKIIKVRFALLAGTATWQLLTRKNGGLWQVRAQDTDDSSLSAPIDLEPGEDVRLAAVATADNSSVVGGLDLVASSAPL